MFPFSCRRRERTLAVPGVGEAVSSAVHQRAGSLSWQLADSPATVDQLGNEEEEDESADRAAFVTSLGDNEEEKNKSGCGLDHALNKAGRFNEVDGVTVLLIKCPVAARS